MAQQESYVCIRDAKYENEDELRVVSYLYASVPLEWNPDFQVTDTEINFRWLVDKRAELKCLVAIIDSKIVGIHILQHLSHKPETCLIKTLWVAREHRGQRRASRLKEVGENWAAGRGCKIIVTNVSVQNSKMLEINKRKGFMATKIEMEKPLQKP